MRHRPWHWLVMGTALIALCVISLGTGVIHVDPGEVFRALQGDADPATTSIIRNLRMPRIILGALVGVGLGMSGGALQGTDSPSRICLAFPVVQLSERSSHSRSTRQVQESSRLRHSPVPR
jgi:ABC-type enterobactin transport system permease subunit